MSIVAIDIGSSYLKSGLWDLSGFRLLKSLRRRMPPFLASASPDARELDATLVLGLFREALEEILAEAENVTGIYLCGQMHGHVLWKRWGETVSHFVSWQDQRTLREIPANPSGENALSLFTRTLSTETETALGHEIAPGHTSVQLVHRKLAGELPLEVYPLSLVDYLACEITGGDPLTDPSNASGHGLYHLGKQDWHWDLIDKLGLQDLHWPRVGITGQIIGHYRNARGSYPVHLPIGDQQASLLGTLLKPDELSLNISTGSQASALVKDWRVPKGDGTQVRPFLSGNFLRTVTRIPAGRALSALMGLFSEMLQNLSEAPPPEEKMWKYLLQEAQKASGPRPQVSLSFYPSAIGSEGALTGLTEQNLKIGPIARGALESMAENYWEISKHLDPHRPWKKLVLSGGLLRKAPLLLELLEEKFQLPSRFSPHEEESLFGLAILAYHEEQQHLSWEKTYTEVLRAASKHSS